MDSITVTTPGKLMLFGEHAVVYGHPCLVTAIDKRLQVTITKTDLHTIAIDSPQTSDHRFIDAAIQAAFRRWGIHHSGLQIETASSFTGNYGFGSSSAVTVGIVAAMQQLFDKQASSQDIFESAYEAVLAVQGVGSGFDVAAATYGGTLLYGRGGKPLEQLNIPTGFELVVGYSGQKADTTTLVNMVKTKFENHPRTIGRIFSAIADLVKQAKTALSDGDWEKLGKYMDFNQEYLRDLGVSSERLEGLIVAAKQAGAYGAKLSGAGGGDCMIALVSADTRKSVEDAIREHGGEVVPVRTNAQGIVYGNTDNQSELFIVVNEQDDIIDYRSRYDCHHNAHLIHRSTDVLLFDTKGRILLQKRSLTKDSNPGLWTVSASGHVSKDETYEQAAHRELYEELGVRTELTFFEKFIARYPEETEMEAVFQGKYEGKFAPNALEVEEVRYFTSAELSDMVKQRKIILTEIAGEILRKIKFI